MEWTTQGDSGCGSQVDRQAVSDGAELQGSEECARNEDVVGHIEGGRVRGFPARHGDTLSMSIETETPDEGHPTWTILGARISERRTLNDSKETPRLKRT